jgi:hypothetical protein
MKASSIIAKATPGQSPEKTQATPPADLNSKEAMQASLNEADRVSQSTYLQIEAAVASIRLMLREPDSGRMRIRIKSLCEHIDLESVRLMNELNCIAEVHDANYIDEDERAEEKLIHKAARQGGAA